METTLTAIFIALQTAPIIAMAITVPFAVLNYAKNRSLNVRWFTYLYVFVLYFLCAYFMTMLPLPSRESFANMRPVHELIQLVPFQNFLDIKAESLLHDIAILVFNVFLTAPLGFFLRYLFRLSFKKAMLYSFLTVLLYEVTQLTGIFFIYPRPYRIFDIDDFIINMLGALIGYWAVPYCSRFIPSPYENPHTLVEGSEVAFRQRCVATAIDLLIVLCACIAAICFVSPLTRLFAQSGALEKFPLFYVLFLAVAFVYAVLFKEGTLGIRLTQLRLMAKGAKSVSRLRCAMRFVTICSSVIAIPFWVNFFMSVNKEYSGAKSVIWVFFGCVFMIFAAAILLEMMFNAVTHGASMFYDRFFKTYLMYGSNRKFSMFGIKVIGIHPLTRSNVDLFSKEICQTLQEIGLPGESVTKARLMTEGVMLDWIENGLENISCELRMDKRYRDNMLMLSVAGENKIKASMADSYAEMLKGLNLTLESYYAAEKNICNIIIPK